MFRAAIFDMDGLLIDSEPYWKLAEREVFGEVGIDITVEMSAVTAPMTTRQVAAHWFGVRPWRDKSVEDMEAAVIARVAELIRARGEPMPGAREVLARCAEFGWRVGLASNSPTVLCHLVLRELGLAAAFQAVVSADVVDRGKPAPAVYQYASRLLGVPAHECLVFEDSATGVRAARAAGMCVVAVRAAGEALPDGEFAPDLQLRSLHEFTREHAHTLWALRG